MTFNEKIDKYMKDNNITDLKQFANLVDIPYTTLRDFYKKESADNSRLSTIRKLSKYMNCTMDYLAYDEIEVPCDVDNIQTKNLMNQKCAMLFDKIGDLSPEKQQIIMNVTESVMKEIDKEIDGE